MSDMDVDDSFEDGSDVEFSDPEPFDSESGDNDLGLSASIEIRRPPSFEALDEAVLLSTNTQLVQEVSEILSLPKPIALILLRQYRYAVLHPRLMTWRLEMPTFSPFVVVSYLCEQF